MELSNGLTFDMIGNVSEEEIQEITDQNITEDIEELFEEEQTSEDPEGVGDGSQEDGEANEEGEGSSPNFYSSIASSLRTDGILNLLDDSDFEGIEDASGLAELIQKQIDTMLSDQQKRIKDALENNVPADTVSQYEHMISYLDGIRDSDLSQETPEIEQLRGNIIVQDYINKGFSPERANKEAKKSFDAGTDIEDAREALGELKKFYSGQYEQILNESKAQKENRLKQEKEQSEKIEKKFLETEEPIKGIKLSNIERKKMLKQYSTFVDKDETGVPLNAIQKYAKDNPIDYQYILNTLFYLTDGFKDLGKAINKEVKSKTKSALSELEGKLKNTPSGLGSGGLNFGNDKTPESFSGLKVVFDD